MSESSPRSVGGGQPYVGEEIQQSLEEAKALIDNALSRHSDLFLPNSLLMGTDPDDDAMLITVGRLMGAARTSVDIALPSDVLSCEYAYQLMQCAERLPAAVRIRVLGSAAMPESLLGNAFAGAQRAVRRTDAPLQEVVIVDGETAVLRSVGTIGAQASVVRSPDVILALAALFRGAWCSAASWNRAAVGREFSPELPQSSLQVLAQMGTGETDDVAARALNMSVRTYRRHVAEILRILDVNSRFQAGARAVELGLLPVAERTASCRTRSVRKTPAPNMAGTCSDHCDRCSRSVEISWKSQLDARVGFLEWSGEVVGAIAEERKSVIKKIICEIIEVDESEVSDTSLFKEDHDADSLLAIEILAALEKEFSLVIDQTELPRMVNVRGVYEVIAEIAGW